MFWFMSGGWDFIRRTVCISATGILGEYTPENRRGPSVGNPDKKNHST